VIEVVAAGLLTTVQDLGRRGWAALGVPRSGAADGASLRLANRMVGNAEGAAALEVTLGGLVLETDEPVTVAVTGAPCALEMNAPFRLEGRLVLTTPAVGLRSYVAFRGGLEVVPVLGSRSTDTLSGIGPAPLAPGDRLAVRATTRAWEPVDIAPVAPLEPEPVLRVVVGPRDDWFRGLEPLWSQAFQVSQDCDRVGIRLIGRPLERTHEGELPSEGLVACALQVPPDGRPVLLLADHPTTGGYPVAAVVVEEDLPRAAQLRPGDTVRFRAG
jgi:biotin-dependent carboxylase-like uncharacterized protein